MIRYYEDTVVRSVPLNFLFNCIRTVLEENILLVNSSARIELLA